MKKLLIMAAAIIFSSSAAAEAWKMTGVMHAPQETQDGYVAVAADCFKQ